MDDLSPWTRWLFVACLLAAVGAACWSLLGPGKQTVASWRVDGPVAPGATEVPLLVTEQACASGQSAEGRITRPDVDVSEDAVTVTIRVRQRSDSEDCPSNPETPYLLRLDEPLGGRTLLDGGTRRPATPEE